MKVTMHINIECEGEGEIAQLEQSAEALQGAFAALAGKAQASVTKDRSTDRNTGEAHAPSQDTTDAPDDQDSGDDQEGIVPRKTYFHHAESDCVFICEKGDTWPAEGEPISKKTYEELLAKYEAAERELEQDTADEGDKSEPEETSAPADSDEELTLKDVQKALQAFVQANTPKHGKDLVASYGVSKLSELDPEHYADIVAKAQVKH